MPKRKTLAEYAAENPQQKLDTVPEVTEDNDDPEKRRCEDLKADILYQLEQHEPLQVVVLNAIEVIGILSQAPGWTEAARRVMNNEYDKLEQQTILSNQKAEALRRLDKRKRKSEELRSQLKVAHETYKQIETALTDAILQADKLEAFISGR